MTECNGLPLLFASLGRKKIVADFAGGDLTSDGGLPLLREVDRKIGLIDAIDAAITDPRRRWLIEHDQRTLLAQRILAIAAGYEDLNDHQTLRKDTLLQALTDRQRKAGQGEGDPLSSPPTLCRLENRITRADLVGMAKVLVEAFIASHPEPPIELVLDFDATDDAVHGHQEGRFFHGYYDHYCFLPLYVTCGQQLLVAYLRPAKIDAAKHSRAILKLLVDRFRQEWPNVKIIFRGDSGFCRWRLMRWCDRHGVDYILGLAKNAVLKRLARRSMVQALGPSSNRAEAAFVRGVFVRRRDVGPPASGDCQGRARRARGEPAIPRHQSAGRSAGVVREAVLPARRRGEPDQGAAVGPVRRPHQLPCIRVQSVPRVVVGGGVRADGDAAARGVGRDGAGDGAGDHDPAEAAEDRRAGGAFGAAAGDSPGQRLPVAEDVRDGPSPAA